MREYDVAVIGGGPAGAFTSLSLLSEGFSVCLFERKNYPREILCGEFLSYEVSNHLKDFGLFEKFLDLKPNKITSFRIFTSGGDSITADLNFTAFGLKRSVFDKFLLNEAAEKGVNLFQPYNVISVVENNGSFIITAQSGSEQVEVSARKVVGAFGKSSSMDKILGRNFARYESPYNGVKIHLDADFFRDYNKNEIHIYTGKNLYCGINRVNGNDVTVCFLEKRGQNDPPVKERLISFRSENRHFKELLCSESVDAILSQKVYGTGNIYFGRKKPVEKNIYMAGDAAGIIAPLAGDGLGMALESARLITKVFVTQRDTNLPEEEAQLLYTRLWRKKFRRRIITASVIQRTILNGFFLTLGIMALKLYPGAMNRLIDYTRK